MNFIVKFFHELFNPHCEHCISEREENKICASCEFLKNQLEIERLEKKYFIEKAIGLSNETLPVNESPKPIQPKNIPWNVRRQQLEEQSRAEALRIEREKEIKKVEKEIGISGEISKEVTDASGS